MNPAPIDEVVDLLRALRLPHMRAAAPELLATAKAQRWEPAGSDTRTAHRGARRPPSILNPGPAQSGRVPHRQDLRRLGRDRQLDPGADPAGAAHPRVDPPPREPRRVRTIRHTQDALP